MITRLLVSGGQTNKEFKMGSTQIEKDFDRQTLTSFLKWLFYNGYTKEQISEIAADKYVEWKYD